MWIDLWMVSHPWLVMATGQSVCVIAIVLLWIEDLKGYK